MFTIITNKNRKKQIAEFIDKDRKVMYQYYDITEDKLSDEQLISEMKKLIEIDKDFYDPYLVIADVLFWQGKESEAQKFYKDAYQRAVERIVDSKGRWPKSMCWGFLENRHLMRALEYYADVCWEENNTDEALDIYRRLLRLNPNDNQGARYNILAIRMRLAHDEWEKPFEVEEDGEVIGLNAFKVSKWFDENAKKFPDEFEWFFQFHKQDEEIQSEKTKDSKKKTSQQTLQTSDEYKQTLADIVTAIKEAQVRVGHVLSPELLQELKGAVPSIAEFGAELEEPSAKKPSKTMKKAHKKTMNQSTCKGK